MTSSSTNAFEARVTEDVGRARRDRPRRASHAGRRSLTSHAILDPDSFVATAVYEDAAAVERQESAPEVHSAMAIFPDALAAPPDRKFDSASRDASLT
jgi:hypothetical protein